MESSSSSDQKNQEFNAFSGQKRMASESSRLFDVFINHRGPDVKQTLAIQLYNSLQQLGIQAFLDSEEKELGDSFPSTIRTAIRSASVHVAIFSEGYADSPWCLAELVLMLESQAKIIPVFYGVKPSDLRHIEKGVYNDAFIKYEKKGRYLKELKEWKKALQSLSLIAGEEFKSDWECQTVVAAVRKEVQRRASLHVAQYPVGLDNLVKKFESLCIEKLVQDFENRHGLKKRKDKVKVVGIFGMGGSGKTTLAKELFNRKRLNYSRASFLFDVREASKRKDLPSLQLKLLKDLFDTNHLSFTSIEEGTSHLKASLQRSPPHLSSLIFLDDIDHVEQLNALLVMDILKKLDNTLVIVITRDVGVLISAGITEGYRLKGMDRYYGSELFCWHAFDQPNPPSEYRELVDCFVDVCGGLPLSLQVLGRHVHGRSQDYWRSELVEVRKTLPQDVKQRLRISFDALNTEEKQIFMDIACFFGGREQSIAEEAWLASGWNAQHALQILRDKCLIEEIITGKKLLRMHDHLRDLGREMAVELSPPHRLWHPDYLESAGLRNMFTQTNARCFYSIFDKSLNSRVTFLLGQSDVCVETSASLQWLQLEGDSTKQRMKNIPSWIPLQSLQCLKIKREPFRTLLENGRQAPFQLKNLDITDCEHLKSVSEISKFAKLVSLNINQCPKLKQIALSQLNSVERIKIADCKRLICVSGISNLLKLVKVEIVHCGKLKFECLCLSGMKCLESITLSNVKVKSFLSEHCQLLKKIKFGCGELVDFSIRDCPRLEEFPDFRHSSFIERVTIQNVGGCGKNKYLHVYGLPKLTSVEIEVTKLCISDCPQLVECSSLSRPSCLEKCEIDNCNKLQNITLPPTLIYLFLRNCNKLQNMTLPATLIYLFIRNCRDLHRVAGNGDLTKLKDLYLINCPKLEEWPRLFSLNCFEKIEIDNFPNLQNIRLPTTLISLSIRSCRGLQRAVGISDLTKITMLLIKKCPELRELPSFSKLRCLQQIVIDSCEKVVNLAGIEELHALKSMELFYCSKATIQNCIPTLKIVQSDYTFVIGRAVDGAESTLNEYLFYDAEIGTHAVTKIATEIGGDNSDELEKCRVLSKVIVCILVVVDSCTSAENINESLPHTPSYHENSLEMREGEWVITMVVPHVCWSYYYQYYVLVENVLKRFGIIKKGFLVGVENDEEWKGVRVLQTIVDRLYH